MGTVKKKHPQGVEQFADSTNTQADATPHQDYITLDGQMSLFDSPKLRITKPVRLIELFSGIGSQAKALQRLGVPFESWGAYDIDRYAVSAYNAIFGTAYEPTDICNIHAEDLRIEDTDKYTYILTYSFPCQDLSIAGHQKGMAKGSGTRSGLLWEVERLLKECNGNLPQIILMENVKQVINHKNKTDFDSWRESLAEMGYTSAYQVMNAKNYGVAQNRERCFMVSWLGDYTYEFPKPIPLVKQLRDYLEDEVDEKYYLSEEQIATFVARSEKHKKNGNGFRFEPIDVSDTHTHTQRLTQLERSTGAKKTTSSMREKSQSPSSQSNEIGSQELTSRLGSIKSLATGKTHQWGHVYSTDGVAPTQVSNQHKFPPLINEGVLVR